MTLELHIESKNIRGELRDDFDVCELDQDILEADLPNGVTISVGWFPECDPNGEFRINAFKNYWANKVSTTLTAKNSVEAANVVRLLATRLMSPSFWTSDTSNTSYYAFSHGSTKNETQPLSQRGISGSWYSIGGSQREIGDFMLVGS
jgi:hypothetical protein